MFKSFLIPRTLANTAYISLISHNLTGINSICVFFIPKEEEHFFYIYQP